MDEGDVARFTVTLSGGSQSVTVAYATGDGTAEAPSDYTAVAPPVLLKLQPGAPQTIEVPTTQDEIAEPTEEFTLTFSVDNTPVDVATVTIVDDDRGDVTIDDVTVNEGIKSPSSRSC